MSTDLSLFEDADLPDHVRDLFGELSDDLSSGVSAGFPVISYRGKRWAVNEGGVQKVLTRTVDGEEEPVPHIDVIIVKANPNISKIYYEGGYEEGSNEKPTCYSLDGRVPARDAQEPQAQACLACPHNVWGSRITENNSKGKACSDNRRLAVVFPGMMDKPMLLRVPAGSLKDLMQYGEALKRRKVPYQAVLTRISFDVDAAHPKFVFKARSWLTKAEMKQVAELMQKDIIQQILGTPTPASELPPVVSAPKTQASVSESDIDAVLSEPASRLTKPKLAMPSDVEEVVAPKKEDPAPPPSKKKPPAKVSALIEEADSQLDEKLKGYFDE